MLHSKTAALTPAKPLRASPLKPGSSMSYLCPSNSIRGLNASCRPRGNASRSTVSRNRPPSRRGGARMRQMRRTV
eukprot:6283820-Pyramimonas_sp.AAC.1